MISQETYDKLHERDTAEAHSYKATTIKNKEHQETTYCFAKGLNKNERTEAKKSHKIRKLEKRFIKESDFAFIVSDRIRNGYLKKSSNEELFKFYNFYTKRIEKLEELTMAYFIIIKEEADIHPNYDKFIDYSSRVLDAFELEIAIRNRNN